jgi:hypothetical protein
MANISLSQVDSTQRHPLGHRHVEGASGASTDTNYDAGDREWVYVKADGVTLPLGSPCVLASGEAAYECTLTTSALILSRVVGVAQHEIASGSFGWILARGKGTVKAGTGGVSADDAVTTGAANGVVPISSNAQCVIGHVPAAISAGATGTIFLHCVR